MMEQGIFLYLLDKICPVNLWEIERTKEVLIRKVSK